MRLAIKRLARAGTIAAAIVALSGSLATGRPLSATLGDVAFKLTAGFSEVEEMRRKINRGPRAAAFVVRNGSVNPAQMNAVLKERRVSTDQSMYLKTCLAHAGFLD